MSYLPAVLGTPLKTKLLERLLRGGSATITEISADIGASRQQVASIVAELQLLGVVRQTPGSDKRARVVSLDEGHAFLEPLRILAVDASAFYETPEAWQGLLSRHYGENWYVGGYAAVRRVMQPIDFEDPHVLVNHVEPETGRLDVSATLERACGIRVRTRKIRSIPPEVLPVERSGAQIWFATPERGFVESWRLKEIPLYGLFLLLVQGLHERALDVRKILALAPSERMEQEMRALLSAPLLRKNRLARPGVDAGAARALTREENEALALALNTVVE